MQPPIKSYPKRKMLGFTLIEVLLALGIFASLAMSANQILRNVLSSNEQTQDVGDNLKALQRALFIMDSDFRQIVARSYRNGGQQTPEQMLELGQGVIESESDGVRFARGGWINPQQLFNRGEVVKAGYRLMDGKLERLRWMHPDDSLATEPAVNPLLDGVESLSFAVTTDGKTWTKTWEDANQMPKAIRITIETERLGKLDRLYLLPETNASAGDASDS